MSLFLQMLQILYAMWCHSSREIEEQLRHLLMALCAFKRVPLHPGPTCFHRQNFVIVAVREERVIMQGSLNSIGLSLHDFPDVLLIHEAGHCITCFSPRTTVSCCQHFASSVRFSPTSVRFEGNVASTTRIIT